MIRKEPVFFALFLLFGILSRGAVINAQGPEVFSEPKAAFSEKPLEASVYVGKTSIKFTFAKRPDLTGYLLYQSDREGSGYKRIAKSRSRAVWVRDLIPGKTYYFKARGYRIRNRIHYYTKMTEIMKLSCPVKKGKSTLKKLLETGFQPLGSTMYIWGGGWNEADTGSGIEAVTIGVSPRWREFSRWQDSSYNYQLTRYQIHDGLDCSGFVGWCIYNILNTESGKKGYVMSASKMCRDFASRGWGRYIPAGSVTDYRAGDIMCSSGHVWIVVGSCTDGSVVILHSSPPGVILCGTPSRAGAADSQAVRLARNYMKKHYPDWYRRFPDCARGSSYLTDYNQMRWDISGRSVMTDPDGFAQMTANRILKLLD